MELQEELTEKNKIEDSKEQEKTDNEIEEAEDKITEEKDKNNIKNTILKLVTTLEFFFIVAFVYLEVVFHFIRFQGFTLYLPYKMLFAAFYGLIFGTIASIVPKLASKILTIVFTVFASVYFVIQIIYSGVFRTYLSVTGSIEVTGQAFDFTDVIWKEVASEWWAILLMLLPTISLIFLRKILCFERHSMVSYGVQLASAVVVFVFIMISFNFEKGQVYTAKEVYKNYTSVDMSVEKLGVMESLYIDLKTGVKNALGIEKEQAEFVSEDSYVLDTTEQDKEGDVATNQDATASDATGDGEQTTEEEIVVDTSPNVLDIDFDEMIANETNSNIVALHQYISTVTPTNKNEYTGMFEGYNLIFVVAEAFSGYVIDPELTPTLYKMSTEGFVFENYYTPLWYGSTLGGEYADLTGLMPNNGSYLSMSRAGSRGNYMMFTLANQLSRQGYKTMGFHNNDYTYYDRHISHPNLGYEWIGVGNGYEPERSASGTQLWPQSDLKMVETTFDLYAGEQPFHTYYLTVSGHVMYNFGGNEMCIRHKDYVENLNYSETTKAYIACQYELELALTELNQRLEEAGIADNTLIVVTADHVPYDNKDVVDELAGEELGYTFDWYKNALIIWSASMEEPIEVDKYCYSLDVLPTVSNLMGLPYDSRMMVGQDILSDSEGMVIFNDRSFITDKCSYDANSGEAYSIDGSPIDWDYIDNKNAVIKNKFNMADNIVTYDYYRYIGEYLNWISE